MFAKYRGVFQSRWKALIWAAGVCLTAYCTVPAPDNSAADRQAAAQPEHVNPWAKGYKPAEATEAPTQEDELRQLVDAVNAAEHPAQQQDHVNPWAKKPQPH